jgi:predicted CopG family antitoxin
MQLMHPKNTISLKTIAISTENYQILKNMGKAADSFNVITHLVKKAGTFDL